MSGSSRSRQELLEEEWLLVRHSGELPEIAFQSAMYCLVEDPEGPRLRLHPEEIHALREAAIDRYQEILLRDLVMKNGNSPSTEGSNGPFSTGSALLLFADARRGAVTLFASP